MSSQSELVVYLAARYSRKNEIREKAKELEALGIVVTSRWLEEKESPDATMADVGDAFCIDVAIQDIEDIDKADMLILFTENPELPFVRGGRHFESGYAYGIEKLVVTVGPKENVFHHLKEVVNVESWEALKDNLKFLKQVKTW